MMGWLMTSDSLAYVPGFYDVRQADLVAWVLQANCMHPTQELEIEKHTLVSPRIEK